MRDHGDQRAAVDAFPAPFEGDETRGFAARGEQGEPLLDIQPDADGDAHALLGQETAAAPPAQG